LIFFNPKSDTELLEEFEDLKKKRESLEFTQNLRTKIAEEKKKVHYLKFGGVKSFLGKFKFELKEYKKGKSSVFDDVKFKNE